MSKQPRRVTALDVARAAGVSKTTVSYVLNATPRQSFPEETRQRILTAVKDLNYTPLSAARALRRGRNDTVLLVVPDWPLGRTLAQIFDGLAEKLESRGLDLMFRRIRPGQPFTVIWRELAPAAVIALGEVEDTEQQEMRDAGIFVASALLTASSSTQAVVVPQEQIGALQAQHLAGRGHRRLGYAAPSDPRFHAFRDPRVDGARRACLELGIDEPVVLDLDLTVDAAVAAVRAWAHRPEPVTGVIAYNDEFAGAVLAAARELGISVPQDLAVIGVDNEPLARFTAPSLSTVDQNQDMVVDHLAGIVFNGIFGEPIPPAPRSDALSLLVREST